MDCGYPHNLTQHILAWSIDHEISEATVVHSRCRCFPVRRYADRPERTAAPATPAERAGCSSRSATSAKWAGYAHASGPAVSTERTEYAARSRNLNATGAFRPTGARSCFDIS